jgi:hypothetical protein
MHDIYGDTGRHPVFAAAFADALARLARDGTAATLAAYAGQGR